MKKLIKKSNNSKMIIFSKPPNSAKVMFKTIENIVGSEKFLKTPIGIKAAFKIIGIFL